MDSFTALEQMLEHRDSLLLEVQTNSAESRVDVPMENTGIHHEQSRQRGDAEHEQNRNQPGHRFLVCPIAVCPIALKNRRV
jgi:hypothetical protein